MKSRNKSYVLLETVCPVSLGVQWPEWDMNGSMKNENGLCERRVWNQTVDLMGNIYRYKLLHLFMLYHYSNSMN